MRHQKRGELAGLKGKRYRAAYVVDLHLTLRVFDHRIRGRLRSVAMTRAMERRSDWDHTEAAEVGRQRIDWQKATLL